MISRCSVYQGLLLCWPKVLYSCLRLQQGSFSTVGQSLHTGLALRVVRAVAEFSAESDSSVCPLLLVFRVCFAFHLLPWFPLLLSVSLLF